MGRRKGTDRVLGPYRDRGSWRIVLVGAEGQRDSHVFPTEKEAREVAHAVRIELSKSAERTIDESIDAYERYLLVERGNKRLSIDTTTTRLRQIFRSLKGGLDTQLSSLHAITAAHCYESYCSTPGRNGRRPAVDTHRNALSEARTFFAWCRSKGWVNESPFDGIEGTGRHRHGKAQLRIDEARRWLAKAKEYADAGQVGATTAIVALLMGMRASEIVTRAVRDLDDEGRLLWIPDSKPTLVAGHCRYRTSLDPYCVGLLTGGAPPSIFSERTRAAFRFDGSRGSAGTLAFLK